MVNEGVFKIKNQQSPLINRQSSRLVWCGVTLWVPAVKHLFKLDFLGLKRHCYSHDEF